MTSSRPSRTRSSCSVSCSSRSWPRLHRGSFRPDVGPRHAAHGAAQDARARAGSRQDCLPHRRARPFGHPACTSLLYLHRADFRAGVARDGTECEPRDEDHPEREGHRPDQVARVAHVRREHARGGTAPGECAVSLLYGYVSTRPVQRSFRQVSPNRTPHARSSSCSLGSWSATSPPRRPRPTRTRRPITPSAGR